MLGIFIIGIGVFWLAINVPKVLYGIIAICITFKLSRLSATALVEFKSNRFTKAICT